MKHRSCNDHRSIFCSGAVMIQYDSALFQKVWQLVLEQGICFVSMSFVLVLGCLWIFLIPDYWLPQFLLGNPKPMGHKGKQALLDSFLSVIHVHTCTKVIMLKFPSQSRFLYLNSLRQGWRGLRFFLNIKDFLVTSLKSMCQKAHFGGGQNLGPLGTEWTHDGGRYSYLNKLPSPRVSLYYDSLPTASRNCGSQC